MKNFLQDLFKNAVILIESSRCKDKFCRDSAVIIYPQKDIVDMSDRVKRIYVHCDIRFFRIVSHNEIWLARKLPISALCAFFMLFKLFLKTQ